MTIRPEELEGEALALPVDKRMALVKVLLDSIDRSNEPVEEIEKAWTEEIGERIEAYRKGETTSRPAKEIFSDLRKREG